MKLYEVPKNSRIRITEPATVEQRYKEKFTRPEVGDELDFKKIDGMYSICYNKQGELIRLAAWNDVEVLGKLQIQGQ